MGRMSFSLNLSIKLFYFPSQHCNDFHIFILFNKILFIVNFYYTMNFTYYITHTHPKIAIKIITLSMISLTTIGNFEYAKLF